MSTRPLRIAYLSDMNPTDPNPYSGGNARIFAALSRHAGEVTPLGLGWGLAEPVRRAIRALPEELDMRLRWRMHLALAPLIARAVRRQLAEGAYDVLFGAYAFHALAGLRSASNTGRKLVLAYTSDATPTGYKRSEIGQSFGSFFAPSRLFDPLILAAERRVFRGLDLALWPGAWQQQSARALYGLDDAQSLVVPWGANVPDPGPRPHPPLMHGRPVRFAFVGRDWQAKGGPLVAETVALLRARGVDAHLTVIGCAPPLAPASWLTVHPALDKARPAELATFQEALDEAHYMFMASFESYGFAFCEAAAHALPVLCLRVGGVPVLDGVSGRALPPAEARPEAFAGIVQAHLAEPARHAALREGARRHYEQELNWDAWGRRVAALLEEKAREKRLMGGQAPIGQSAQIG